MTARQVISASRRTDLPAFHAAWLAEQLGRGEVVCENPFSGRPYTVDLSPGSVHSLVLWSRNFLPLLDHWDTLRRYNLSCMLTLTALPRWLEPGAPGPDEALEGARWLADRLPAGALVWRYDPVLLGPTCPEDERVETFADLAPRFAGLGVRHVIISYLSIYPHLKDRLPSAYLRRPDAVRRRRITSRLLGIAGKNGMSLSVCADPDLRELPGLDLSGCIDASALEALYGPGSSPAPDRGQRKECRCTRGRDIGSYRQACGHGCLYCYAQRRRHLME